MVGMDVLASRIIVRPTDPAVSQRFYRDTLGLAVFREFGGPDSGGVVFFAGQGLIEVSGRSEVARPSSDQHSPDPGRPSSGASGTSGATVSTVIWLQVRDVATEHSRLRAEGVPILREPRLEFWGLIEMWIADPDGHRIVLVEIPADHPLRRDARTL
jgi:catechol 2,3-dioxygenase-like lactoylglutathione lyase family enzyme